MKIRWLGHSSFLITSRNGTRIVTDPFTAEIGYDFPGVSAEFVTISHDHFDHNNSRAVQGAPVVISGSVDCERNGIRFQGITSYHDEVCGEKRGLNTVFLIEVDGVKICHLGDLGQPVCNDLISAIGQVDVLLIPVGGTYTIDHNEAINYVKTLAPTIVIPMHFKTPDLDIDVNGVDAFLSAVIEGEIVKLGADTLPITREVINGITRTKIIVLDKRHSFNK